VETFVWKNFEDIGLAMSQAEGLGSASSKPAPFAEKKNAKGCGTRKIDPRPDLNSA